MSISIKSKSWNWGVATAPQWEEPAAEVYPLISRWHNNNYKNLLDLGCGIGRHSFLFAENGFEVEAFDLSDEGIKKVAEISANKHLPIKVKVGDMLSLPYDDNSFDCLIAFHAIYHTDEKGLLKVITEIKRVLKTNGEALITFNSQNSSAYKDPKNKHLSKNVVFKTEGHEVGIPHFYATKTDIQRLLDDFEIVNFDYKEEYWQDQEYTGAHYFVLVRKVE